MKDRIKRLRPKQVLAIGVILLLVMLSVAPAWGLDISDVPDNATNTWEYVPESSDEDNTCTNGPTGSCWVMYVDPIIPEGQEQNVCGADKCKLRVEWRW